MGHSVLCDACVSERGHQQCKARKYDVAFRLRGLLLIVAILLVGTGFTFIKHVLSDRERKLFFIAIPLQVRSLAHGSVRVAFVSRCRCSLLWLKCFSRRRKRVTLFTSLGKRSSSSSIFSAVARSSFPLFGSVPDMSIGQASASSPLSS